MLDVRRPKAGARFFIRFLLTAVAWALCGNSPVQGGSASAARQEFVETVSQYFPRWDTDHDQILSAQELDAAIQDSTYTGRAAAALVALKKISIATNYSPPLLTLDRIRQMAGYPPKGGEPSLSRLYSSSLRRIGGVTQRDFFASGLPRLETIRQGEMGDCFCLAPLGAMIHRNPREVVSLFSCQTDGTVRVLFGSGPVTVKAPTDAELAITSGNTHDGVWVNLYEKAVSQICNDWLTRSRRSGLPLDAIANGGSAAKIMACLTGHRVSWICCQFATNAATTEPERARRLANLRQQLFSASRQNALMVSNTQIPTTPGLNPYHVFALLGYDTDTDTVELWNPHGNNFTPKGPPGLDTGYPTAAGLFRVPIRDFVQEFCGVTFELLN